MKVLEESGNLLTLEHRGVEIVVDVSDVDPFKPWIRWRVQDETPDLWGELAWKTNTHPERLIDLIDQAIWWYDVQRSEGQPIAMRGEI